jgi:hypothetical protein
MKDGDVIGQVKCDKPVEGNVAECGRWTDRKICRELGVCGIQRQSHLEVGLC